MKAPCVFPGARAGFGIGRRSQGNYSLFNMRADLAKADSAQVGGVGN
ncbi:hypothetical protein SBA1_1210005 [Candidatus Sulfotelmatobacter kueseliae]|uniref:Uncharacterized protein n=1 Tax=Candidatus Sulfotelmatobacter kueseliae TaxID=2042962 RepID=A0A2U3K3T4_9BACT|nr:hypothetical protein SBA1_1210005 [Candidatus Sulfotelmatobacter kueseliae]